MKRLTQFMMRPIVKLGVELERLNHRIGNASLPDFANAPSRLMIQLPRRIRNPHRITLGDDVKIGPNSVLSANTEYPGGWMRHPEGRHVSQTFDSRIIIGDRVTATSALQLVALQEILIEDDVMFAANVFVCDGLHSRRSADEPYKFQGMNEIESVRIGRGSWIGQNVVLMPGVTIGELAIVGANSVVTRDVPARSIAVGNPARVIKRWNERTRRWHIVDAYQELD
ncbi:MAG: acyltransferase [Puniceicoccaceae bacterium]|nr:MAG: acyltransferase [Puniceicoccaceae bacterium]